VLDAGRFNANRPSFAGTPVFPGIPTICRYVPGLGRAGSCKKVMVFFTTCVSQQGPCGAEHPLGRCSGKAELRIARFPSGDTLPRIFPGIVGIINSAGAVLAEQKGTENGFGFHNERQLAGES
jgi:hypothetical protein